MSVLKDYRLAATSTWVEGRRGVVTAREKPDLDVATPPEFRGEHPDLWSPEELLLAACSSCYQLTVAAVADHRGVPLRSIEVRATGHVTRRGDGRLGFVAIELDVDVAAAEEHLVEAETVARRARDVCLVTMALGVPLQVRVRARAPEEVSVQ